MLIHGAGVDHGMWTPQMEAFAQRYRVLTFDLRGHGRSRPANEYSFDALVDDAFALLDLIQAEKVALIGLSMGGNIAQGMVFRDPSRLTGVVCADCTCNTIVPFVDRLLGSLAGALFAPLLAIFPRRALLKQAAEATASTPAGRSYVRAAMSQYSRSELTRITKDLLTALRDEPGYRSPLPQLLCRGEDDRLGNIRKIMPKWARRDTGSELIVIPRASHCSNIDNPEVFNRVVLEWLEQTVG